MPLVRARMAASGHEVEVVTSCAVSYLEWDNALLRARHRGRRHGASAAGRPLARPRAVLGDLDARSPAVSSHRRSTPGSTSRVLASTAWRMCCATGRSQPMSPSCCPTCTCPRSPRSRPSPDGCRSSFHPCAHDEPPPPPGVRAALPPLRRARLLHRGRGRARAAPVRIDRPSAVTGIGVDVDIPRAAAASTASASVRISCASGASTPARARSSSSSGSVATRRASRAAASCSSATANEVAPSRRVPHGHRE